MRRGPRLLAAAAAYAAALGCSAALACGEEAGLERVYAAVRPAVVRVKTLGAGEGCSTTGAGFFVAPTGLVMTAKHVVPESCQGQAILVAHEGNLNGIRVRVARRSALDIAVLEPEDVPAGPLPYLDIDHETPPESMLNQRVVVSSFPDDYEHANWTAARVDAVVLAGSPQHWMLCGPAANPGRSGSAVITASGRAIAVFVERPRQGASVMQDLARVLPIRRALDLPRPEQFNVASVGAMLGSAASSPLPASVAYSYPVHYTTSDPPTDSAGWYWIRGRDGRLEVRAAAPDLVRVVLKATPRTAQDLVRVLMEEGPMLFGAALEAGRLMADGWVLRFQSVAENLVFRAIPGYRFEPNALRLSAESHNPREAPLPNRLCRASDEIDCFLLSEDRRMVTVRMRMYRGADFDRARGWFHGELQTQQTRM